LLHISAGVLSQHRNVLAGILHGCCENDNTFVAAILPGPEASAGKTLTNHTHNSCGEKGVPQQLVPEPACHFLQGKQHTTHWRPERRSNTWTNNTQQQQQQQQR
jgi:hypothetical protein